MKLQVLHQPLSDWFWQCPVIPQPVSPPFRWQGRKHRMKGEVQRCHTVPSSSLLLCRGLVPFCVQEV